MSALIRAALPMDLPGAYRVCLLTGDSGRDGSALYRNPDLLGHVYVGPYILSEPGLAQVVADEEGIAGYCLATADTRAFEAWCEVHWWPVLRTQYPPPAGGAADLSPDDELVAAIHGPERTPNAVVGDYPAHLHIDLLERARGLGMGRALIERQLTALREPGVPGVHLRVAADNANAIAFYEHLGFQTLDRHETSVLMGRRLG